MTNNHAWCTALATLFLLSLPLCCSSSLLTIRSLVSFLSFCRQHRPASCRTTFRCTETHVVVYPPRVSSCVVRPESASVSTRSRACFQSNYPVLPVEPHRYNPYAVISRLSACKAGAHLPWYGICHYRKKTMGQPLEISRKNDNIAKPNRQYAC